MDLDQLHTFLEIVRLKSFSKAAQTCFRTQPAISAQVRQLEQELGTQLFDRFGSRIALTTAGKIFAQYAEQILALRRQSQDAINELERTPRGDLVVAANEATWIYILPEVFHDYRRQFPHVHLLVDRSYGSRILDAVQENLADFGIVQLPVQERKLQVVKIHSDEIRLIVPAGHELADKDSVTAPEVARFPLILQKYGTTRARLNEWLELVEDDLQIAMELDSTEMLKRFVLAGMGIAFMAGSHCREEVSGGRLHAIPLSPEPMLRRLALVYRKDKALSKAALGFIEVVLKHAGIYGGVAPHEARRAAQGGGSGWNAEP
ncbi:MAG TPA: LysR family transcriptional regulator [Bryobacteraceae bacterium]|nr:LysR family transcriptional regulator [Bryobacteraceae bacterium]